MDAFGKSLFVAYQCGGPSGRPGHDSLEMFDVSSETSSGIVTGPPMVGAPLYASPDGKLVLLDSRDACSQPYYDHVGCPPFPSHVAYLVRTSDRRVLWPLGISLATAPLGFPDNERFLLQSKSLSVIDASRYKTIEAWDMGERRQSAAFDYPRRRVYLGSETNSITVFEAEGPGCPPTTNGLSMFYPGDGTMEDAIGTRSLQPHGNVRFVPGRVGQAFFLDGVSYLSQDTRSNYRYVHAEASLALYAKLASIDGEMVLLDWTAKDSRRGIDLVKSRLLKSTDNHIVFQWGPGGGEITSKTSIKPDVWYHIVVTETNQHIVLYLNGEPEANAAAPERYYEDAQLLLGARNAGEPAFHGWLDEVAFYGRALRSGEVGAMYQARESGPCKP